MTARFRSKNTANAIAAFLVTAALGSAVVSAQQPTPPPPAATPAPAAAVASAAVPLPDDYVIGPEDVLSVVFWRDKDMSADVTVRPDGKISLPLLNDVQAAGLTPIQLRDRLVEVSKQFFEDPSVSVVVKNMNSRKVFVTGQVTRPGPYALVAPTTVLQLISIAGGLGDYAKSEKISIVRNEGGKQTSFKFNYKEVINSRRLDQNIELKPGDTVVVP